MVIGRFDEELNNLIFYIDEYQNAKINLDKAISLKEIKSANFDLESNLLAIECLLVMNHELKETILPNNNKMIFIEDTTLSTDFIIDVNKYIQRVKSYS